MRGREFLLPKYLRINRDISLRICPGVEKKDLERSLCEICEGEYGHALAVETS